LPKKKVIEETITMEDYNGQGEEETEVEDDSTVMSEETDKSVGVLGMPDPWWAEQNAKNLKVQEEKHEKLTKALGIPVPERLIKLIRGFSYMDGQSAIRELNRIFGWDCWQTEVKSVTAVKIGEKSLYYAVVGIRVDVPNIGSTYREDVGSNAVNGDSVQAHDTAIKGAVTDAIKRAARQFGEALGLSLYPEPDADATPSTTPVRKSTPRPAVDEEESEDEDDEEEEVKPKAKSKSKAPICDDCGGELTPFGDRTAQEWAVTRKKKYGRVICGFCVSKLKKSGG
jgi:hypothetical protein